jgi:hypothetical protein
MRPIIEVQYPDGRSETVELSRERSVVGRSPKADIRINDNRVSREHCALEIRGDRIFVIDLGGSNGTWIGASKLLANVPEPFPREEVVHVGPAQLHNVTDKPSYDPDDDLESQAFVAMAPQRPQAAAQPPAGAPVAAAAAGMSASEAALEPVQRRLAMSPGERSTVQLNITNQSKIVEHYMLSVAGVPATWITIPTSGLELLPRQSGTLNVDIHPPRHTRTTAGIHTLDIALLNQAGQVVTQTRVELEILPFENLVAEVRPNPYQSRSGGVMIVTVENHGNAQTDYHVTAVEASDSVDITVDPANASVAPQQSRENNLQLRPRKRNWIGDARRMNITITVAGNTQSITLNPAYTQLNLIPRWLPILALLACCVIIPLFAFLAWPEVKPALFPTDTPVPPEPTSTLENTPTATPDIPATQTATRALWCELDDDGDGLLNCEEENIHLTRPDMRDTDNDGLSDFNEVKKTNTDPLANDTDGDTLLDGEEEEDQCLSPSNPDSDLDGVPDQIDPDSCVGITPTPSPVPDFALGGQVNNSDAHLDVMEDARMSWVKVQLRFGIGADANSTVQDVAKFKEKGFKVLLSVVGNREELERGGPAYHQAFADFLGAIAPVADGIEVWNEPNIQNEWPVGQINPADYTEMLRKAYDSIKSANQRAIVISAAPAPTGVNNETVMSDDRFIGGMMSAGARNFMDCIGIHYNAGATPPSETSGHPDDSTGHYSYYFLPMVDLYYDTFNPEGTSPEIPLCFTEIGYVSDDGFDLTLAQAGANNFLWADGISERDQAEWLEEALLRSCRSGKVKLFVVWNVGFENYGEDPQAGYAIFRPDEDCPSCETLSRAVGVLRNEGCMR